MRPTMTTSIRVKLTSSANPKLRRHRSNRKPITLTITQHKKEDYSSN